MSCCKKNNTLDNDCKRSNNFSNLLTSDYLVCTCMGVMHSEIVEAIDQGINTFEALSEKLGVGTGCSSCVAEVHAILSIKKQSECCKS